LGKRRSGEDWCEVDEAHLGCEEIDCFVGDEVGYPYSNGERMDALSDYKSIVFGPERTARSSERQDARREVLDERLDATRKCDGDGNSTGGRYGGDFILQAPTLEATPPGLLAR
jgi:hypothetical protein